MSTEQKRERVPSWAKALGHLLVISFAWIGLMTALKWGFDVAYDNGDKDRTPGTPESYWCCDGDEVACTYGPGIVGKRKCAMHWWMRCEPDPRYLVNDAGR